MKKVLFDGFSTQGSSRAKFHGGGEYAKFMLKAAVVAGFKFDIVFSDSLFMDEELASFLSAHTGYEIYKANSKEDLYRLIDRNNYDVFYSPLPMKYVDYSCHARLIGVIHGLRSIELPWEQYRYKYYSKWYLRWLGYGISLFPFLQSILRKKHINGMRKLLSLRNASFITVSNHSKYSILNFFPFVKEESLQVFYSPFSIKECKRNHGAKGDYFLMVSGNRYEKNVYRAVCAFDKLFSDGRLEGKKVVITGCGTQPFWKKIQNKERFDLLPYVSTDELEALYANAFCFVYPSLNEGFGYPPLKAMGYGVPVIASSATSIPEVCAYAACYFTPTSIDDMTNRILQIDLDPFLYEHLSCLGKQRVKELLEVQEKNVLQVLQSIF